MGRATACKTYGYIVGVYSKARISCVVSVWKSRNRYKHTAVCESKSAEAGDSQKQVTVFKGIDVWIYWIGTWHWMITQ